MKKVLITFSSYEFDAMNDGVAKKMLADHGFDWTQYDSDKFVIMPYDEFISLEERYDAIITRDVPITEEFLKKAAPKLKIIARYGVGYDEIDIVKAREYGVAVTISKEPEHTNGVAETAYALLLAMLYHIPQYYREYVLNRNWFQRVRNIQLKGKTIGFFGFGAIARCFAEKLGCAGVTMLATDIYPDREAAQKLGVRMVPFDELLAASDIISIHAPGVKENRHIFNADAFAKMKDGAYLLNTARGILVDEKALYEALVSGKLRAAAADVMYPEPADPKNPLFDLDNFIATPHIAGHTVESRRKLCVSTAKAIIDHFEGRTPHLLVN